MKKLFTFLTLAFLLTSCSINEDSSINVSDADLIGTWNVTSQTVDSKTTTTGQGMSVSANSTSYGKDFDYRFIFSEDPKVTTTEGTFNLVTTISIDGQEPITQETPFDTATTPGIKSGAWSLSGDVITITDVNNQITKIKIIEFSGDYLKLKATTDQSQSLSGFSVKIEAESIITLEK